MAKPRTPKAKLKATGQDLGTHAKNYKDRKEIPARGPLGDPPKWMKKASQLEAWETFRTEIYWLNHSHRGLVEIASEIRGRLIAGEDVGVQALNLLRQCLGQMGASPSDSSKVSLPDGEADKDPSDNYF
jgi:hypothetical protein